MRHNPKHGIDVEHAANLSSPSSGLTQFHLPQQRHRQLCGFCVSVLHIVWGVFSQNFHGQKGSGPCGAQVRQFSTECLKQD